MSRAVPGAKPLGSEIGSVTSKIWWLTVIRGLLLIVLGVLLLVEPLQTIVAFVWVFGVFSIIDGLLEIIGGISGRGSTGAGWLIALGVANIALGVVVLAWPGITLLVLYFSIAFWSIVSGLVGIALSFSSQRTGGWFWPLLGGLVSVAFGVVLLFRPGFGLSVLLITLAIYAFAFGIFSIAFGFTVRRVGKEVKGVVDGAHGTAAPGVVIEQQPGEATDGR